MDINAIINRVKNILLTPATEWPVIGAEQTTVKDLYLKYIMIIAAVSAIAYFISNSIVGTSVMGMTFRTPFVMGLVMAVVMWGLALLTVFLVGLLADVLAPSFGGERNQVQGLKLVAYAATASWIGSIAGIVPWIGWLIAIAASIYGIYLIYLGAPHTTKVPADRAAGYTAVLVLIWIVITFVVGGMVTAMAVGGGAMSALSGSSYNSSDVTFDKDSPLGKLESFGKSMEAASKQMEAAEKSGDSDAQANAAMAMLGTMMGGGKQVEAVGTDVLKALVPESLAGMERQSMSSERSGAMGMQVSNVEAEYGSGKSSINLHISDAGGASGILGLASWASVTNEREDKYGYEKTYKSSGHMVNEKWNKDSKRGEYSVIVANRFVVKVEGNGVDMGTLKSALGQVDINALAAMKDVGVKSG